MLEHHENLPAPPGARAASHSPSGSCHLGLTIRIAPGQCSTLPHHLHYQRSCVFGEVDLDAKQKSTQQRGRPMWTPERDARGRNAWLAAIATMLTAHPSAVGQHFLVRATNSSDGNPFGATAWGEGQETAGRSRVSLCALVCKPAHKACPPPLLAPSLGTTANISSLMWVAPSTSPTHRSMRLAGGRAAERKTRRHQARRRARCRIVVGARGLAYERLGLREHIQIR